MKAIQKEFEQIGSLITHNRAVAIGTVNYTGLLTYWQVGGFVSNKLAHGEWGSKVVDELVDFLKTRYPNLKGYGRRHVYNMVKFYEAYHTEEYAVLSQRLKLHEFVQSPIAQLAAPSSAVQSPIAQLADKKSTVGGFPYFLSLIPFTSHIQILNGCRALEERVFYIMYAVREHLDVRELRRSIANQTYDMIMSRKKKMSPALKKAYPLADFMLKDKAFLDFLALPAKHTEHALHAKIKEKIRDFILEIGKDFMWMGNEYHIQIGGKQRRLDLLFYHRGLQCLVDVELKAVRFEPEFVGKMDLYLAALDREIRRPNENPSVGIILCPNADAVDVAYTLDRTMSPMMVAEYRRQLIPEEVMKKSFESYCSFMKKDLAKGGEENEK